MDGSNGKIVSLLERIAAGQEAMAAGQEATNERLGRLEGRLDRLADEMRTGLQQVNSRLDHVVGFLGAYHQNHEQRIQALEERVFKKSG